MSAGLMVPRGTLPKGGICGPYALAAVTGRPPHDFMEYTHKPYAGMTCSTLCTHLSEAGFSWRYLYRPRAGGKPTGPRLTLRRMLGPQAGRGIVCVYGHWLAFDGALVVDTIAGRHQWVHDHRCAGQRVLHAFVLTGRAAGPA